MGSAIHVALGAPTLQSGADEVRIDRPQYALSYSPRRNGPTWVSWELNASYFGDVHRHRGKFLPDESLPAGVYRVQHDDYTGSRFDRGHMVRSEERTRTREDNDATFLMTNVLPQRHELNAGPWLGLEDACDRLARKGHELFIVAGGVYDASPETIGHGVAVPTEFFKVVVDLPPGAGPSDVSSESRVIAVLMPNSTTVEGTPWTSFRTTAAAIERRTGLRFFGQLPESTRQALVGSLDTMAAEPAPRHPRERYGN